MAFTTQVSSFGVAARPVAPRSFRRVATLIRAEQEGEDQNTFFKANRLATRGYLEEDSAGQENIFAVQPKKYIQGSDVDETTGSAGNTVFGVAGAIVALVVIAGGTTALFVNDSGTSSTGAFEGDFSGLSTLSEYKAKFVAETRQPEIEAVEAPFINTGA